MKEEFPIEDQWVGFELHPETPEEGIPLAKRFPGMDLKGMFDRLTSAGSPYGIRFNDRPMLCNSRKALEASEFARDCGRYEAFHHRVFRGYFEEGRNIGDPETLAAFGEEVGLDPKVLREVLNDRRYAGRLDEALREGQQLVITGVPTFFIGGVRIVGAQPIGVFRDQLKEMERRGIH